MKSTNATYLTKPINITNRFKWAFTGCVPLDKIKPTASQGRNSLRSHAYLKFPSPRKLQPGHRGHSPATDEIISRNLSLFVCVQSLGSRRKLSVIYEQFC